MANHDNALFAQPVMQYETDDSLIYLPTDKPSPEAIAKLNANLEAIAQTKPSASYVDMNRLMPHIKDVQTHKEYLAMVDGLKSKRVLAVGKSTPSGIEIKTGNE